MIDQEEIHNQFFSENPEERRKALEQLEDNFSLLPDKQQAWNDLHRLTNDNNWNVRFRAVDALGSSFLHMPDKQQAWNDLIKLTTDVNSSVRYWATSALGSAFLYVPDKQKVANDLHKLTIDEDSDVKYWATSALGSAFTHVPDKQQVENDLHKLTNDEDSDVRYKAAFTLGSAFSDVPDKQQAGNDFIRLITDKNWNVRCWAASILGSVFPDMPDKQQAGNDLIKLTTNEDSDVRSRVASILGSVFPDMPDKQQAWNDLHRLTNDENIYVRISANHSLGKVSIFRASQSEKEEEYKRELEKAIKFFEKASREASRESYVGYFSNPSEFCLPFYHSFYTIIFQKQEEAKEEVGKYLKEAKYAVGGSKSKEVLLEAVNNLANALKEVQNLENLDFQVKKDKLNFYRQYCDRAAELMIETEETAPFATIAMKKGLPIFDRNLKEILKKILKKTELISEQTKGTQLEKLGDELNQNGQFLLQVRDPVGFKKRVDCMQNTIKAICSKFPEGQKSEACELLKMLYEEPSIEDKIPLIDNILSKLSYQLDMTAHLSRIEAKLDLIQKELDKGLKKLDILSKEVGGKEGELIQTFSKKILELTEKEDKEALQSFLEEVLTNENALIEEIENSSAPLEEKEESKTSVSKMRSVLDKVKQPIKSFGKDVTNEIIVSYAAEEIVKLVFQLVLTVTSTATLGIPISPQILNLLKNVAKEINK